MDAFTYGCFFVSGLGIGFSVGVTIARLTFRKQIRIIDDFMAGRLPATSGKDTP